MQTEKTINHPKGFSTFLANFVPNPQSESLWHIYGILYLAAVAQWTLIPKLFPAYFHIDLITPWVAVNCITKTYQNSCILAFSAGWLVETQTSTPMGQMILTYWLLASLMRVLRSNISWRSKGPWILTLMLASVLLILGECIVLISENSMARFDFTFLSASLIKVMVAGLLGLTIPASMLFIKQKEEPL